jgi:hypothetical protein
LSWTEASEEPVDEKHPPDYPVAGEVQPPPLGHRVLPGVACRALTRLNRREILSLKGSLLIKTIANYFS